MTEVVSVAVVGENVASPIPRPGEAAPAPGSMVLLYEVAALDVAVPLLDGGGRLFPVRALKLMEAREEKEMRWLSSSPGRRGGDWVAPLMLAVCAGVSKRPAGE